MTKVSMNINLDADLKRSAQELLKDLGMDLTTAVTIFLRQTVRDQGMPFRITRDIPNAETLAALEEYEAMKAHPEKYQSYANFQEVTGQSAYYPQEPTAGQELT